MNNKAPYKLKPASQELIKLYTLMGEALASVQLIEDALSYAIAMKKDIKHPRNVSKAEADKILKKYRRHTLGDAIGVVKDHELFHEELVEKLDVLKGDRNWLIHRSLYEALDTSDDKISFEHIKDVLYVRIKTITNQANDIQHLISEDLMKYSEEIGLDMTETKQAMEKYYQAA